MENIAVFDNKPIDRPGLDPLLTAISDLSSPGREKIPENQTKISGCRPAARDGHTGVIIGFSLFVFGGDRHHNPFNDLYVLDLLSELDDKGLLEFDDY